MDAKLLGRNWSKATEFCTFRGMARKDATMLSEVNSHPDFPTTRSRIRASALVLCVLGTVPAQEDPIDPILFDTIPALQTQQDFSDGDTPFDAPPVPEGQSRPSQLSERTHAQARQERCPKVKHSPARKSVGRLAKKRGKVNIPAGCFWMGSPDSVGSANEHPRHQVCVSEFQLDKLPVLQFEFEESTGWSPWSLCKGATCTHPSPELPAWYVTWNEADSFCRSKGGRLPTEAEFEYAARAGDSALYVWGDSLSMACDYANFADVSLLKVMPGWAAFPCSDSYALIAPAGGRKANRWGLYDMAGNVWEWTSDWYGADWYSRSPKQDPVGPLEGTGKVMRGGSWLNGPTGGRVAYRDGFTPDDRYSGAIGFRCAYPVR